MELTSELKLVDLLLPPVDPPAIFAIGLNYADHAKEVDMPPPQYPIVFMKSTNTLIGHGGAIIIPAVAADQEVDYEAELAVVIGRKPKTCPLKMPWITCWDTQLPTTVSGN